MRAALLPSVQAVPNPAAARGKDNQTFIRVQGTIRGLSTVEALDHLVVTSAQSLWGFGHGNHL